MHRGRRPLHLDAVEPADLLGPLGGGHRERDAAPLAFGRDQVEHGQQGPVLADQLALLVHELDPLAHLQRVARDEGLQAREDAVRVVQALGDARLALRVELVSPVLGVVLVVLGVVAARGGLQLLAADLDRLGRGLVEDPNRGRIAAGIGLLTAFVGVNQWLYVAVGAYTLIVWSMYKSMVKNFDMTIRRQSR